ncbi:type I restriction endonuclease [Desulfobacterales bacterium HSG17]|nr:type I restriction endonuclease [Desulfobacterales bacterium HSG17]
MKNIITEKTFEQAIENLLLTKCGYIKSDSSWFDKKRGIDPSIFMAFIRNTQADKWQYLQNIQKEKAEQTLLDDLCKALDSKHEGCLKVLRHGFKCFGKLFRAAFFAPASTMNPETSQLYNANRLTVTRQLYYSDRHNNSLDLVLSLNGIPLITAELKNPFTEQTFEDAITQYKQDRDPADLIFQFKKRTLVHFAVDPDQVYMTTRLAKADTIFLPFNLGNQGGAGNPENPDNYKTAYLWEKIWHKDCIMDILGRFIHLETKEKKVNGKKQKKETMIFPRYHQWDAVCRLEKDAKNSGAGRNYLIQHSAGSGKSNSIAWLAHRLSSLYNEQNVKCFDSVIIITDRRVLDQQLQNTVYQFEHKQGVIKKVEKDSTQLANALVSGIPIIITTLQKFPFVTEKIGELPKRKYAVIIDEAHSSQSGESAIELKGVLAGAQIRETARAFQEEQELPDHEEEILRTMAKRGRQPNISFFAFTATPKYKTLEVFGQPEADGHPAAFHYYTMRQAIEENFILDVLNHYTTYETYYQLIKSIEDDPEVDKKKAARALARFVSLHPHNIAQKTEVMIEHFQAHTRHKIGRKAKAMLVTGSRLHAKRYKQEFDRYISEKGYNLKVLVAFSGTLTDPDIPDKEYTEVKMNNGIKEKELPERFASDEFHILIVAEKYQTGFDQPLLHTMYVDKRLSGIQAVQTLQRLNRIYPGKDDTFILDFVNNQDEILESFTPYYEHTIAGEQVDPRQLYEIQARLDAWQVYYKQEVEQFCKIFYKPKKKQSIADQSKLYACINPAVERFKQLDKENQEEFRKVVAAFKNLYAFLSQIIPFQDSDLEKLYTYLRFLVKKLPKRETGEIYKFDEDISLEFYRLQKISEGSILLEPGAESPLSGPAETGTGTIHGEQVELSRLIDLLNDRFGTNFTKSDQLFIDAVVEDAVSNPEINQAALVNPQENFNYTFDREVEGLFIDRMEQNEDFFARYINDKEFQSVINPYLSNQVYNQIRSEL